MITFRGKMWNEMDAKEKEASINYAKNVLCMNDNYFPLEFRQMAMAWLYKHDNWKPIEQVEWNCNGFIGYK